MEDRLRGIGSRNNEMQLKPIDNGMIKADGGVLVTNSLRGNNYGCTMANGHFGEVEVSNGSVIYTLKTIESVYGLFKWDGLESIMP